ncbi:uncharacterized protein H6S33_008349 [Morchella sextelata]|uniref:uncharacterized protein n=1 Tax=Morchella sextelata TaxID=1174677 RepID=UPI001D038068|nr:uncharacterized protein H6S33_008349 [Morchella sextelata]KAH0602699.1 hypothetical protein H6S33_008349 [Morchella sextelata]
MARRRHSHVQVDKAVEVQLLKKSLAHLKLEKAPKAKTARRQMSSTEKGMIIAFFFCFGCIQTVSAIIGRPWSTIKSFIQRTVLRDGNEDNLPRSGRPPLLSRRQKKELVKAAKNNRRMTKNEFRDKYAPGISLATVDRVLRQANIKKWLAKHRPLLKPEHVKKWLDWAMQRKDWGIEEFMSVIWSDECAVERSKDPRQIWVFREPDEKWLADCIYPKPKDRGPLVPVPESMTGIRYLRIIKRYLPSVLRSALIIYPYYPRIADTKGGPPAVKRELARVLPLVWETIPPEFFEKLAASMPRRVEAVIQAKGWYTKY